MGWEDWVVFVEGGKKWARSCGCVFVRGCCVDVRGFGLWALGFGCMAALSFGIGVGVEVGCRVGGATAPASPTPVGG